MMIDRQLEIEKLRNEAIQLHRAGCVTFDELDEFAANAKRLLYANPQSAHCCRLVDILNRRFAHRAVVKQNEELRARVAELESRERWVPVGERLPEEKTAVVVRRGDGTIGAASTCRICGKFHSIVTHWRPMPEGPKDA